VEPLLDAAGVAAGTARAIEEFARVVTPGGGIATLDLDLARAQPLPRHPGRRPSDVRA
jgi:hypothetical protein